MTIYVRAA